MGTGPDLSDALDAAVFRSTGYSCPGDCPDEKPTPEPSPEIGVDILPDPGSSTVFLMILKETAYVAIVLDDVSYVGAVLKVCAQCAFDKYLVKTRASALVNAVDCSWYSARVIIHFEVPSPCEKVQHPESNPRPAVDVY